MKKLKQSIFANYPGCIIHYELSTKSKLHRDYLIHYIIFEYNHLYYIGFHKNGFPCQILAGSLFIVPCSFSSFDDAIRTFKIYLQ